MIELASWWVLGQIGLLLSIRIGIVQFWQLYFPELRKTTSYLGNATNLLPLGVHVRSICRLLFGACRPWCKTVSGVLQRMFGPLLLPDPLYPS